MCIWDFFCNFARKTCNDMKRDYPKWSSVALIAAIYAIARAAVCRCPRTRYRTGRGAKFMVFLHTILPARWWDWLVVRSMAKM